MSIFEKKEPAPKEPCWVLVVQAPLYGTAVAVAWGGIDISQDIANTGSTAASDLGLDNTPGAGAWIFEGTLAREVFKSGGYDGPPEYDEQWNWEGTWRRPTVCELTDALLPRYGAPEVAASGLPVEGEKEA